jgi:hypothetical protein
LPAEIQQLVNIYWEYKADTAILHMQQNMQQYIINNNNKNYSYSNNINCDFDLSDITTLRQLTIIKQTDKYNNNNNNNNNKFNNNNNNNNNNTSRFSSRYATGYFTTTNNSNSNNNNNNNNNNSNNNNNVNNNNTNTTYNRNSIITPTKRLPSNLIITYIPIGLPSKSNETEYFADLKRYTVDSDLPSVSLTFSKKEQAHGQTNNNNNNSNNYNSNNNNSNNYNSNNNNSNDNHADNSSTTSNNNTSTTTATINNSTNNISESADRSTNRTLSWRHSRSHIKIDLPHDIRNEIDYIYNYTNMTLTDAHMDPLILPGPLPVGLSNDIIKIIIENDNQIGLEMTSPRSVDKRRIIFNCQQVTHANYATLIYNANWPNLKSKLFHAGLKTAVHAQIDVLHKARNQYMSRVSV